MRCTRRCKGAQGGTHSPSPKPADRTIRRQRGMELVPTGGRLRASHFCTKILFLTTASREPLAPPPAPPSFPPRDTPDLGDCPLLSRPVEADPFLRFTTHRGQYQKNSGISNSGTGRHCMCHGSVRNGNRSKEKAGRGIELGAGGGEVFMFLYAVVKKDH